MSRAPGTAKRRLRWPGWIRRTPAGADPGDLWAAEVLRPLRRQTVECDIAPRVMSRIAAERRELRPAAASPRVQRLALASSLLLACACLAFLVSTLLALVVGGDQGVREIVGLGLSCWHVLAVVGRLLADFGTRVLALVLPILRALWALLDVGAPLLRGAGVVAAAGGVVSILFSTVVFASARKTAPRVNFQGGTR
jgi:hypothetical protein